jgi:hypothetical protein
MIRLIILFSILIPAIGCLREKDNKDEMNSFYVCEIVNFDLNCSTCIIKFPDDSMTIKSQIGESRNNYYQTVNLSKDTFKISQRLLVKVRKPENNELRACITLFVTYDYKNIYIIEYKSVK